MNNNPEKYFAIDDATQDYFESNAKEVLENYRTTYLLHKQNAEKLLILLISGLSAVFVLLLKNINDNGWGALETGYCTLIVLWMVCSYCLLHFCIQAKATSMAASAPERLYFEDPRSPSEMLALGKLKRFRLHQFDRMIEKQQKLVIETADALNWIRLVAAMTPVAASAMAILHWVII